MRKINRTRHIRRRRPPAIRRAGISQRLIKPVPLFFLALTVAVLFAVKGLWAFLGANPAFKIAEVEVRGTYPLDSSIKTSIRDTNIFKLNLKELSRKIIARHPEILKAEVRRFIPNKVMIKLETRLPFAAIESQGYTYKTFFVDQEGFVLTRIKPALGDQLPKILGINTELARIRPGKQSESIQLTKALALLKQIIVRKDSGNYKVTRIDVTSYKNLSFFIDGGIEVKIGAGNFKQRLNLLDRSLPELKDNPSLPKYIDLRFGDPIIGTR